MREREQQIKKRRSRRKKVNGGGVKMNGRRHSTTTSTDRPQTNRMRPSFYRLAPGTKPELLANSTRGKTPQGVREHEKKATSSSRAASSLSTPTRSDPSPSPSLSSMNFPQPQVQQSPPIASACPPAASNRARLARPIRQPLGRGSSQRMKCQTTPTPSEPTERRA